MVVNVRVIVVEKHQDRQDALRNVMFNNHVMLRHGVIAIKKNLAVVQNAILIIHVLAIQEFVIVIQNILDAQIVMDTLQHAKVRKLAHVTIIIADALIVILKLLVLVIQNVVTTVRQIMANKYKIASEQ